jgi:chaperone BCS1
MFFDGKEEALSKIDFFLKNKEWYYEMGIPYTLGVGLHGEPGTGKTSFIKALANKTGRHIIVLSLQMIKTRKQLTDFWYETQYNSHNKRGSVDFSSKIIVIEDIDCAGDIVLKRFHKQRRSKKDKDDDNHLHDNSNTTNNTTKKKLNGEMVIVNPVEQEDPIHLDDILNVIDGIRETPGRILVMTSNHYDKLDEALVRPGRIDLTISLSKVSKKVVSEMYEHYNKAKIPKSVLSKIKEDKYTPAEAMARIVHQK